MALDEPLQICVYFRASSPLTWGDARALPGVTGFADDVQGAADAPVPDALVVTTVDGPVLLNRLPPDEVVLRRRLHLAAHGASPHLAVHLAAVAGIWHLVATGRAARPLQHIVEALARRLDGLILSTGWYRPGGRALEAPGDRRPIDALVAELPHGSRGR